MYRARTHLSLLARSAPCASSPVSRIAYSCVCVRARVIKCVQVCVCVCARARACVRACVRARFLESRIAYSGVRAHVQVRAHGCARCDACMGAWASAYACSGKKKKRFRGSWRWRDTPLDKPNTTYALNSESLTCSRSWRDTPLSPFSTRWYTRSICLCVKCNPHASMPAFHSLRLMVLCAVFVCVRACLRACVRAPIFGRCGRGCTHAATRLPHVTRFRVTCHPTACDMSRDSA